MSFAGLLFRSAREVFPILGIRCVALGYPPPYRSIGIIGLGENCEVIYGAQSVTGKILSRKGLGLRFWLCALVYASKMLAESLNPRVKSGRERKFFYRISQNPVFKELNPWGLSMGSRKILSRLGLHVKYCKTNT